MQKTISSSCYDAIVIKQENRTYRSTPFQVVFSSNLIKIVERNRLKNKAQPYKITLFVNDKLVDSNVKIDHSGRIVFEKVYNRKAVIMSDSSEVSDDDHSHKSSSHRGLEEKTPKSKGLQDKLEQYKNQHAPTKFWQFAWLFNHKKDEAPSPLFKMQEQQNNQSSLTKIKQQIYQGQVHSKQPLFHLSLCGNLLKKKETREDLLKIFYDHRVEYNQFIRDPTSIINDGNLVVKIDESIYTWQLGITILTCRFAFGRELTKEEISDIIKNKFTKSRLFSFISGGANITKVDITEYEDENQILKAQELKKIKKAEKPVVKYKKTPDSEILRKMKLKYGKNIAKFELDVGGGTKETITMKIFLWDHSEKIIISDIDGTITKSDILGQILSNYIHPGVTKLYNEIYKRHYKIIYLTARAIGQYQQTSKFLETVEENSIFLPEGPLLMSPDGYMRSFTRQVIYKTPDFLKTKILASLNQLFPNTKNPIYCGFGNRATDSAAYLKINISPDKIYCITDKSVISRESDKEFSSTYIDILANVNEFFPEYFKDNAMVDSDEDEVVESYEAVEANIEEFKKTKSVDGDRVRNLDGYEFDDLSDSGNLSKSRKSEQGISKQDLKSLQQNKFFKSMDFERIESELLNERMLQPVRKISHGQLQRTQENPVATQSTTENKIQTESGQKQKGTEDEKKLSTQQLQKIVMNELKEDNEVAENQVIPNFVEDENKSQDSKDNQTFSKTVSEGAKSVE